MLHMNVIYKYSINRKPCSYPRWLIKKRLIYRLHSYRSENKENILIYCVIDKLHRYTAILVRYFSSLIEVRVRFIVCLCVSLFLFSRNLIGIIMPKEKQSVCSRLRRYATVFGSDTFSIVGNNLFCEVYEIRISPEKKFNVSQHISTDKDQKKIRF